MSEANKALVRRWQDAYNSGDLDTLDEVLAPDWETNAWPEGMPQSVEAAKAFGQGMLALFPDLRYEILDLIAEGDTVAMRYRAEVTHSAELFGLPPTGKRLEWSGINMFRVSGGRIVGHWGYANEIATLEALGAEFPPEWAIVRHRNHQDAATPEPATS